MHVSTNQSLLRGAENPGKILDFVVVSKTSVVEYKNVDFSSSDRCLNWANDIIVLR